MTPRTRRLLRFALVALAFVALAADSADAQRRRRHRHRNPEVRRPADPPRTRRHRRRPPRPNAGRQVTPLAACQGGGAAQFPCRKVDLLAVVPISELAGTPNATLNDIWGWTDGSTGREYALVGLSNGVAFVDITEPREPEVLGRLPTRTLATPWRDVKVYRDHAYIVADNAAVHGMQVFDLTDLRGVGAGQRTFSAERVYYGRGNGLGGGETLRSAHNVAIDEESGFAYVLGAETTCDGGLHMVSLNRPARPRFAGCFTGDGYTHDAQCVVYRGPDQRYRNDEVCFAANEDTITIVDTSDKQDPRLIARAGYAGAAYVHQVWLTENHRYLLSNDELDELQRGNFTRTFVWDVRDLENPTLIGTYDGPTRSTDHNFYVRDGLLYQANYRAGLRILALDRVAEGRLREVGFFDIVPGNDAPGFDGAWSVYPFFPSGNVVVSGIGQGLFVLRPQYGNLP